MGRMSHAQAPQSFGRVDDDGTVYVRTSDGERSVGQVPDSTSEEALEFFVRRYRALETEVSLLESRVSSGTASPEEARSAASKLVTSIREANAVGDLESLAARVEALTPTIDAKAETRREERAEAKARAKQAKEEMVAQAEAIAAGSDWRGGIGKFRDLLDQWRRLPRIDKTTDDELWHRFSGARTAFTRRRKQHMAEQNHLRERARMIYLTSGAVSPVSTRRLTTSCGTVFPVLAPHLPVVASSTWLSRTTCASAPASSRSTSLRRLVRWPSRPLGVRPLASSATS